MPGPQPIPGHAGSGEPPCGADDEDCESSGSGDYGNVEPVNTPKVVTDDIYLTSPEPTKREPHPQEIPDHGGDRWNPDKHKPGGKSSTTTDSMVITVNMTETPPKKTVDSITTSRRPHTVEPSGEGNSGGGSHGNSESDNKITSMGTSPKRSKGKGFDLSSNIILIVGITGAVLLILLILAFAIYKYKSRDEGSYKIDESKNYPYQEGTAIAACKPSSQVNGGSCNRSGMQTASKPKKNVKEWYV